jgi:hypothetical protein
MVNICNGLVACMNSHYYRGMLLTRRGTKSDGGDGNQHPERTLSVRLTSAVTWEGVYYLEPCPWDALPDAV